MYPHLNSWRSNLVFTSTLLAVVAVATASCGGGSGPTEPVDPSRNGNLTILMVDDPTDEICKLWVYFEALRVKPDGESAQLRTLGVDPQAYDLLTLRDGTVATLGQFQIAQGPYQFIEVLLDQTQSFVVEKGPDNDCDTDVFGDEMPLQIPSEKFKVNGIPFDVTQNTTITIDFDAKKSLKRKGSETNPRGWKLKPDVSIIEVDE